MIRGRNIDTETFAFLQEEQDELNMQAKQAGNRKDFGWNESTETFSARNWEKRFDSIVENKINQPVEQSPFLVSSLGSMVNEPIEKAKKDQKDENIFQQLGSWISENPGKALLGVLLLGGGANFLTKYIRERSQSNNPGAIAKRRRKRKEEIAEVKEKELLAEKEIFLLTAKDAAIGAAAVGVGALAGTVLKDYTVAAAVPVTIAGLSVKNIAVIAAAVGLAISSPVRKLFKSLFSSGSKEIENSPERLGYVRTMLGYVKPDRYFSTA